VFPDLPTLHEAGVPGYEITTWAAMIGPAGLPKPIVTKLNQEMARACDVAESQGRAHRAGRDLRRQLTRAVRPVREEGAGEVGGYREKSGEDRLILKIPGDEETSKKDRKVPSALRALVLWRGWVAWRFA
jgi:hypothetical protein